MRIHIIHMNDLHSKFENMPKIATYVKKIKASAVKDNEKVVVVDIGDHMDRMRLETEGTGGSVNVEILNKTGVDIATIGNNEGLTFTKELLAKAYQDKEFKVVACNLWDISTNERPDWLDEYWIQEIDGLKIGWLGATAPYETFYHLQGWNVAEPLLYLKEQVSKLRDKVDILILLSHLGIKADQKIAEELPELDAILGGHTHRLFEHGIKNEKGPLICQVGILGNQIGHLTIEYDASQKVIKRIQEKTVQMSTYEDDGELLSVIQAGVLLAKKELNKVVVELNKDIPLSIESESPLPNLLADSVRKWVGTEIGIVNNGQFLAGLERGIITKERIHHICPSPINVCRVTITGEQLKETLEQSLLEEFVHYPMKGFGFRGEELGTLAVSGLKIYYDLTKPKYNKIEKILIDDVMIKKEEFYQIATLDMFTFGGGYPIFKEAKDIQYFLPEFIRDILAQELILSDSIDTSFTKRWFEVITKKDGIIN